MGYGVYEEPGNGRWAGYMVPAPCDYPGCEAEIDRGLGWKCEEHVEYTADGTESEVEGCGLFFCEEHRYETSDHHTVKPKPDSGHWTAWQLVDDSWEQWRVENPERVAKMRALVTEADLTWARAQLDDPEDDDRG
ncbi:hypothetical protein ACFQHV_01090 [Promicromonospora thailandica]|uniref:Uncharacterized protein n=1 Tax=Promicromonospora thailandica TaxID=765201 RepID=A0A9X2GBQ3_9MICO|nr:hypothetical protein [Promicromonospora thailandica]MCP2265551.1 hypothetical protein [Promicromonospora thailandica]BFF17116.1 hypothetical protein GCM10025730_06370 [Promicromonospora thailandica]